MRKTPETGLQSNNCPSHLTLRQLKYCRAKIRPQHSRQLIAMVNATTMASAFNEFTTAWLEDLASSNRLSIAISVVSLYLFVTFINATRQPPYPKAQADQGVARLRRAAVVRGAHNLLDGQHQAITDRQCEYVHR